MNKKVVTGILLIIVTGIAVIGTLIYVSKIDSERVIVNNPVSFSEDPVNKELHPMAIKALRQNKYPGGDFLIEETLTNGTNYKRFIASYKSEGLKIFGLLTVPLAPMPTDGFPAVIFVHGYIPPNQYSTVNSYPTYQATLARAGFVTFKPDLRGPWQFGG